MVANKSVKMLLFTSLGIFFSCIALWGFEVNDGSPRSLSAADKSIDVEAHSSMNTDMASSGAEQGDTQKEQSITDASTTAQIRGKLASTPAPEAASADASSVGVTVNASDAKGKEQMKPKGSSTIAPSGASVTTSAVPAVTFHAEDKAKDAKSHNASNVPINGSAQSLSKTVFTWLGSIAPWLTRSSEDHRAEVKLHRQAELIDKEFPLTWVSGFVLTIGLCCCGLCQAGLLGYTLFGKDQWYEALFPWTASCFQANSYTALVNETDKSAEQELCREWARILYRETLLMLILPLFPLVLLPLTTCADGTPTCAYLMYIPFMIRARVFEWRILPSLSLNSSPPHAFLLQMAVGTLEHFDWFSDGAFVVQTFVCDAQMTPGFTLSFSKSKFSFLTSVVSYLHFGGIALICFTSAALLQQAFARFSKEAVDAKGDLNASKSGSMMLQSAVLADLAGLQATSSALLAASDHVDKGNEVFGLKSFLSGIVKGVFENVLQVWLQSSAFSLTFTQTSRVSKVKALASIAAGLAGATVKLADSCSYVVGLVRKNMMEEERPNICYYFGMFCCAVILCAPLGFGLGVIIWTSAKIAYTFHCPTHLWNLSSGCVS
eukprot:TRINITY_DN7483_c0_g1_i1.p1 TRINITY_DN7483_c0_g1~~TRINITY_DN7483_c0_g1_i1.p1  ORF type:complete len:605 (+),score=82.35 TRINITY_DN7483_c0_g1_i1:141-1955(+)